MPRLLLPVILALGLLHGAEAMADNSVFIESKTVLRAESDVAAGVYLENDMEIFALVLPLEIRSLDPGAYITHSLTLREHGRMVGSGLLDFLMIYYGGTPVASNPCSGPLSSSFTGNSPVDFVSPDGVYWHGMIVTGPAFPVGLDGRPGTGTPSFILAFDATTTPGRFEIDTCCWAPASHLHFDQGLHPIHPRVTKGVITIGDSCACAGQLGDLVWATGAATVLEVVQIVDVAFGRTPPVDPDRCRWADTDVNCDGVTDVIDAVRMINVVFRGYPPESQICNPCDRQP